MNFDHQYVLKTDGDSFVDIDSLIRLLEPNKQLLLYMGNRQVGAPVRRSGKNAVSMEEHPAAVFDTYNSGGGYILSQLLVGKLVPTFDWEHPLSVEDAYIGGRVIKVGVWAEHRWAFDTLNRNCRYNDGIVLSHPVDAACMKKLYELVMNRRHRLP